MMRARLWAFAKKWWDEILCAFVLLTIGLFLLGYDVFGLSGPLSSLMAFLLAVLTALVGFVMAALIMPLVGMISAFFIALAGAVGVLVGMVVMPIVTFFVGLYTTLLGWLAGTWLGTLLTPIYNLIWPIVGKIAPWVTVGRGSQQALAFVERHPALIRAIPALGTLLALDEAKEARKATPARVKKTAQPTATRRPRR